MRLVDLLKVLDGDMVIQLLPANPDTIVYKKHNNQFTDQVDNFINGNGVDVETMIVVLVAEQDPNWEVVTTGLRTNEVQLLRNLDALKIYVKREV